MPVTWTAPPSPPPRSPTSRLFPGTDKRYGKELPLVIGRAVVDGQCVYQSTPGSGQGYFYNGSAWVYGTVKFMSTVIALCEAPVTSVSRCFKRWSGTISNTIGENDYTQRLLVLGGSFTAIVDATATAWSAYVGTASEGLAHSGTCHVRAVGFIVADDGSFPETRWEVQGTIGVTAQSGNDAEPAEFLKWLLTDTTHGLGFSTSLVDVDYGADGSLNSGFRRYTRARGWYLSRVIDEGTSIADVIHELLLVTNSTLIEVDGKLKAIPLDDEASSTSAEWPGHASYPYTPPSGSISIGDADYATDGTEAPIEVERVPRSRVRGIYPVDYTLRKDDSGDISYATNHAEWQYDVFTAANGIRRAEVIDLTPWILSESHAWFVSYLTAQREQYHRTRYVLRLKPAKGLTLAAGDFIQITDSKSGLSGAPARVEAVERDGRGRITAEALEWPLGTTKGFAIPTTPPGGRTAAGTADWRASQETVDTKVSTFAQTTAPTANAVGDLWIDTDDSNRMYRCTAVPSTWADIRDGTIIVAQQTADGKNKVFVQAAYPTSGMAANDLWFNTDTSTNCDDDNCKGHTLSGGAPQVGAYPHRKAYWPHRYDSGASEWKDAAGTQQIITDDLIAGVITAAKVSVHELTVDKLTVTNLDDLIPNANSELENPPAGSPEAAAVSTDSPYAGSKCRKTTSGDDVTDYIACTPGDKFYFEAQAKRTSTDGLIYLTWYNSSKSSVGNANVAVTSASYALVSITATAPANAVWLKVRLVAGDTLWVDAMYLRRVLDEAIVAAASDTATAGSNWTLNGNQLRRTGSSVAIFLSATASVGAVWTDICTLPIGYRPSVTMLVVGHAVDSSTGANYPCWIEIVTGGTVRAKWYDDGTSLVTMFTIGTGDGLEVSASFGV